MAGNLTKQAIQASFIKLLNQRPLDKITVKDVVEDCGVNRNTFYYHYQDIFALLEDIFRKEAAEMADKTEDFTSWQDGVIHAARFALENKRAIYHIYNSARRDELETYFYQVAEPVIEGYVLAQAEGLEVSPEDIRILSVFYKHAVVGVFHEWLLRGMRDEPEQSIARLGKMLDGNIRFALEKAASK